MKRSVALGAVLAVFLVGLAGGVAGAHLFYAHKLEAKSERVPFLAPHYQGRLDRSLDLSPQQEQEIRRILRQAHEEAESLRREVRPRIHQLMEGAHEQIREVLTPEQRQRFEELPLHKRRWRGPRSHHHREGRDKHRRHSRVVREGSTPSAAPDAGTGDEPLPETEPPESSRNLERR